METQTFGQPVTLRVVRVDDVFGGTSTGIASGQQQILSLPSNTFTSRLPIKVGESIALDTAGSPKIRVNSGEFNNIVRFIPPLAGGETRDPGGVVKASGTLALNADVEPDADGDGFGDETQDGCPTDAAKQGPCSEPGGGGSGGGGAGGGGSQGGIADLVAPRISVAFKPRFNLTRALRAGRTGALAGTVRSSEGGRLLAQAEVPGRRARQLGLQRGASRTAIVAKASVVVRARGSAKVKFRFTRRAKRALQARPRVGLTLRFTVRGQAENPSVATRRVTLAR